MLTDAAQIELDLEESITIFSKIIEDQPGGALPMLLVTESGTKERGLFCLSRVDDNIRPRHYIEQVADTYRQAGKGIDQMILQNEAWMHLMDMETGEVGLEECASFVLFNRNGTHKCIIIPFVRLGDGTVNWRPRQSIDDSFDGEVPDAMKEAMS